MELNLCLGCMREKAASGSCPYCGFQEEVYHPLPGHLPLYTILNGKYLVGKVLGYGGFGVTYLGYDLNLKVKLAIKEYFPHQIVWRDTTKGNRILFNSSNDAEDYQEGLSKFLREAQVLAKFWDVPGIVPVKDYFQENNTAYIVMKYIEGESLKQYIDRLGGKVEPDQVLAMIKPLLESLSSVHQEKVIHGDISPKNILVGPNNQLCLIDFGATKILDVETLNQSANEFTPGYAPPEQYGRCGQLGPWSDIYALCATIYRAITGVTLPDAMDRFIHMKDGEDPLKKPSQLGIILNGQQEEALMKGLAVEKEKRFSSLEELLEALYASPKRHKNSSYTKAASVLTIIGISGLVIFGFGAAWSKGHRMIAGLNREQNVLMTDIVNVDEDIKFMVFGSDIERTEISQIIFTDDLSDMGENCWDVSEAQDGKVMAWIVPDGEWYDLYIGGEGGVKLNENGDSLFAEYDHVTAIDFNNCVDASGMTYLGEMFYNCRNLKELDLGTFETAENITLYYTFFQCSSLKELDLSSLDTSGCQEMTGTFRGCNNLISLDVSHFDTSQVESMAQMFMECSRLSSLDVSHFNTSHVTNMDAMFAKCFNLSSLDVSNFDTSQVNSFYAMFDSCQNLSQLDLTNFDTSQCMNFGWMFANCLSLTELKLGSFQTEEVRNMASMFINCKSLVTLDLTNFITSKVTDMSKMFALCVSLQELDVHTFDTTNVTDNSYMFYQCSQLDQIKEEDWNIDNVVIFDQADDIGMQGMQVEPIIGGEVQITHKKAKADKDDLVVDTNVQVKQTNLIINKDVPTEQSIEHEGKIQHIRNLYYGINAKADYQIIATDTNRDYIDSGVLVKAVFVNDINNLTLPLVECYYENNLLIFAYGKDGVDEYRYYFENGNLIREVGKDNIIIDYPNGDGFLKTVDSKAAQIYGRGQWETALVVEGYYFNP